MDGPTGNMIHSTVPPGQINRATRHKTVSEFWHVLDGEGEIWRSDGTDQSVVKLVSGVSIDIPRGYRLSVPGNAGSTPLDVHLHLDAALAGGRRGRLCRRPLGADNLGIVSQDLVTGCVRIPLPARKRIAHDGTCGRDRVKRRYWRCDPSGNLKAPANLNGCSV